MDQMWKWESSVTNDVWVYGLTDGVGSHAIFWEGETWENMFGEWDKSRAQFLTEVGW